MHRKVFGVALAAVLLATPALGAPITLKFNSPAPPPSFLHNNVFRPWITNVEKASKGTLKIQLYVGGTLGNFKVAYDRVVDDVADIGFMLTAFAGGKFKKFDVAELPFQSKNSTEAAFALWKIYASGIANDEFDKVKPLAIWTFPNNALHTKSKITSLDDVKGMRVATSSASNAQIIKKLGGVPVTFTPPDTYEAISRGIASGSLMPFTGMRIFKINEVTNHHLDEPLGGATAMMFINKQKYDSLPPEAKAAIDKYSYMPLSEITGKATDANWAQARALVASSTNTLSPEQEKKWKAVTQTVVTDWVHKAPEGAKILKAFQDGIKEYRSGQAATK